MTNKPAVLPDARAQEIIKRMGEAMSEHFDSNYVSAWVPILVSAMMERERISATPPAPDAAVPAGEGRAILSIIAQLRLKQHNEYKARYAEGRPWSAYRHASKVLHHLSVDIERVIATGVDEAAAPKVASDTGAGLRHENELLRVALNEIDVIAGTTTPPDGDAAAWRALEDIIKLIHPFRTNGAHPPRAALATDATDGATGGGEVEPFAYFQRNEAWGSWEEVAPEHKDSHDGIVAAYRQRPTTPGGDLLEQAARVADEAAAECEQDEQTCDVDDRFGADRAFGGKIEARKIAKRIRALKPAVDGGEA